MVMNEGQNHFGYALSFHGDNGWSWRMIEEGTPVDDGETYYATQDDFPQEAKDWFASHIV
jgi:hypothetical protein